MAFLGTGLLSPRKSTGARLGEDLGSALQGLAHHKIQQKQASELEKVGFPKELASVFHSLDPKVQQDIWKQVNLSNIGQQQEQQQQPQMQQMQQEPKFTPEQTEFIKSIPSPMDRQKVAQQFQQQNQQAMQQQSPNQQFGEAAAQQQVAQQLGQQKPNIFSGGGNKLEQQQALALYKDQIKQDQEERKIQHADEKESKKWYREKNKKAKGIKENNARLERMRKLVNNGKLSSPETAAALDSLAHGIWGVGINLKGFQHADSQEFEKLSNDMLKGVQDIFGSRILKTEVDNFMKTIPTLLQSDAGKIAVIDNLKMLNEANLQEDKVAKEIIKANGGKIPANLEELVDSELGEYLDDIHERFVNQTHEVPETHTKSSLKNNFVGKAIKQGLTGSLL